MSTELGSGEEKSFQNVNNQSEIKQSDEQSDVNHGGVKQNGPDNINKTDNVNKTEVYKKTMREMAELLNEKTACYRNIKK